MITIDSRTAVRNRQGGRPNSVWSVPTPESAALGYESLEEGYGGQRVYSERLHLKIKPKFQLGQKASFFAAGSCFAREIELALHDAGQTVRSWNPTLPLSNSYFHRYNTFSIINDFQFAFGRLYDEKNIMQIGSERFCDYSGYGVETSAEEVLAKRHEITDIYRGSLEAEVVIITLGLVEAWFDKDTQTYLNIAPYQLLHKFPDRFELRITGYEDNKRAVRELLSLVHGNNSNVKIILTVSPVPFSDTFSDHDVITANMYSKSVLRAVAQDIAEEFSFVDYFPSYEIVMLSNPAGAWMADHRHVKREHVNFIVSQFTSHYFTLQD